MRLDKLVRRVGCAALACLLAACQSPPPDPITRDSVDYLGTVIHMAVYDGDANEALDEAFARIADIDRRMATQNPDSEISVLSRDGEADVSPDTAALFALARDVSEASGGAFDITIGPLVALWGIGSDDPRVPSQAEIDEATSLVDERGLQFDPSGGVARLKTQSMAVDLGGIAKGYACDETVRILRAHGVRSALLDLGGNIYALGKRPDGRAWKVGLRTPIVGETDGIFATLAASDCTIVTSGGYERYFEQDGVRYHHILDPVTGYPSDSGLLSATIVGPRSATADALSTACFVLGRDKGLALAASMGYEAIFVADDRSVTITDGLRTNFALTDDRFTLVG